MKLTRKLEFLLLLIFQEVRALIALFFPLFVLYQLREEGL
jgi:hypothetical protein